MSQQRLTSHQSQYFPGRMKLKPRATLKRTLFTIEWKSQ